ncbi:hypothetical protein ACWDUH_06190 [Micromonospora wenchangensis]
MIERGSGRTSGLTDWQLMDVLSMWACLQDQETPGHWKHVAGWRKVCELAQNHLRQLRQYRAGLAEAWPPATNAAARTYLGELDELISKVQRTHDTAAANHDALAAVARAIDSTRPELKRIRDDYAEKLARKRGYEATLADPKAAAGSRVVDPPVTDADLERLNVQARGLMFGLSGELQQAQAMLQKPPPPPRQLPVKDASNSDVYNNTGNVVIPPVIPVSLNTAGDTRQPSSTKQTLLTPPAPQNGPVLGNAGATSTQQIPTGTGYTPSVGTPSNGAQQPISSVTLPPTHPSYTGPKKWPPTSPLRSLTENQSGAHQRVPPRVTPLNGLIGSIPGMGAPHEPADPPTRKINPVGGVIGGGAAGTAPTGGAGSRPGGRQPGGLHIPPIGGSPSGAMDAAPTRSGRFGGSDTPKKHWDPDQPWEIEEGITPIVRPPEDGPPIDPGPAIGFNR